MSSTHTRGRVELCYGAIHWQAVRARTFSARSLEDTSICKKQRRAPCESAARVGAHHVRVQARAGSQHGRWSLHAKRGGGAQRVQVCRLPWNEAERQQRRDSPVHQVRATCQQAPSATGQARGIRGRLQARLQPRLPTCWLAGASAHSFLGASLRFQKSVD